MSRLWSPGRSSRYGFWLDGPAGPAPPQGESHTCWHPPLKVQRARAHRDPDPARDPKHGPVRRFQRRGVQDPGVETSWPSLHRHVRRKPGLHSIADTAEGQAKPPLIARPATEAWIPVVVLQGHAGFLYRHRLAARTRAETPYRGSLLALLRHPISAERAGVEVRGRPNVTRRGRGGTRSTPGGTGLRGIRTRSGRTNRGGTAACPDGRSPRREGLASKRSRGADTAHTASVPRRRGASAKAFDRIVTARRTRPSATCALAGNGRMAERRSHWSPARCPATPRETRHR